MTLTRTVLASILAAFVFAGDLSTAEATHIKTFIDPQLTKAPVAGFRELVIDPAKVTQQAIINSCSIAASVLTTNCLITEIREEEPPMMAGGGADPMGGMPGM